MAAKPAKGNASAKKTKVSETGKSSARGKAASGKNLNVKAGANGKLTSWAGGARTAASACAITWSILPLDDLSNAACEAVANNVKGTMALPHAYGRLQFGAGSRPAFPHPDRHRLQPQRRRRRGDRHRGWLDQARRRRHRQDRQARRRLRHRGPWRHRHHRQGLATRPRSWCSGRPNCSARSATSPSSGSRPNAASRDTTTGLSSCPTVGNMYDKLIPRGIYGVLRRDLRDHRRRASVQGSARRRPRSARSGTRCGRPTRTT